MAAGNVTLTTPLIESKIMIRRLDEIRWKKISKQLKAARAKRDNLLDEDEITKQDELIWELEDKYAHYVVKYYG